MIIKLQFVATKLNYKAPQILIMPFKWKNLKCLKTMRKKLNLAYLSFCTTKIKCEKKLFEFSVLIQCNKKCALRLKLVLIKLSCRSYPLSRIKLNNLSYLKNQKFLMRILSKC